MIKAIKTFFDSTDFDEVGDSMDLWWATIQDAFNFDALKDKTIFLAKVITPPVPMSTEAMKKMFPFPTDPKDDIIIKKTFKARILGNLSHHRFWPDPCDPKFVEEVGGQEAALEWILKHTDVIATSDKGEINVGDTVRIRLEPNIFTVGCGQANLVEVVQSLDSIDDIKLKKLASAECATPLSQLFNDFVPFGSEIADLIATAPTTSGDKFIEGSGLSGITSIVQTELNSWSSITESDAAARPLLKKYWDNLPGTSWTYDTHWSAAFISWVISQVDSGFPKSAAHYYYTEGSINGIGGWTAWKVDGVKIKAQVGDILVKSRPDPENPKASHGDVLFKLEGAEAVLAGGNLGKKTLGKAKETKRLKVSSDGFYEDFGDYIVVLKKSGSLKDIS